MNNQRLEFSDIRHALREGWIIARRTRLVSLAYAAIFTLTGGIILAEPTKDTEAWNINVAKVLRSGPLAFKRRDDPDTPWPEGVWAKEGDFVMVPRYGGDRRSIDLNDGLPPVVIVLLDDRNLLGRITGNPCKIRAYIA